MSALERRAVSSVALLYSFRMIGLFMVLPLLSLYSKDTSGATPALIGLALGIYGLSQALLQIPFGWLSDRVGRKPVIIGGLLVFAIGSLVAATADTMMGIIIGRAIQGAGAIAAALMALLADLTREEQRTKAMAIVGISIGMSFAVALVLGPMVAAMSGLAGVFYLTAGLAMAGVILVLVRVPQPPPKKPEAYAHTGAIPTLMLRSLLDSNLARLYFGVFVLHFVLMASFLVVPQLLESVAGIEKEGHWKVYLAALVMSVVSMIPIMGAAERWRRPRQMFYLAILLIVSAMILLGCTGDTYAIYLGLWVFFTGFNYLEATLPSLVSKTVFSGATGTALGIFSTCQFLGAFVGGAIGGWLIQVGSVSLLFAVCIALGVIWLWVARPLGYSPVKTPQATSL